MKSAKTAPTVTFARNAASAWTVPARTASALPAAFARTAASFAPAVRDVKTVPTFVLNAEKSAQTVQRFVRTAVKNAKTALTMRCAESAAYASIVSAVRATTVRNAANAKTVWMPSVSAAMAAQTVQRSVRTVTKSVQTVPRKKSAAAGARSV